MFLRAPTHQEPLVPLIVDDRIRAGIVERGVTDVGLIDAEVMGKKESDFSVGWMQVGDPDHLEIDIVSIVNGIPDRERNTQPFIEAVDIPTRLSSS